MLTSPFDLHTNVDEFRAIINYTAAELGFRATLIEKDYFCSLLLNHLYQNDRNCPLIFKGGTLLAKVYGNFYRLSEDLDFAMTLLASSSRKTRKEAVQPIKLLFLSFDELCPTMRIGDELKGSNASSQYNGEIHYDSLITNSIGRIRFEISLRESILDEPIYKNANTILLDPFTGANKIPTYQVRCFTSDEAYAEKVRAALYRIQPAIRDYYDLHHALQNEIIDFSDPRFLSMVRKKIELQKDNVFNLRSDRIAALHDQIESELYPTLRTEDHGNFQLNKVISRLAEFSKSHIEFAGV